MVFREWEKLPAFMQVEEVRPYYDILQKKKVGLLLKRMFDITVSAAMCVVLLPVFAVLAILISADSKGGVFYRQVRITQYGKRFRILKFRTMAAGADKIGPQVTVSNDKRITKVGGFLRRYRLDELPQLFNILAGDMTFVGARPEVPKYVKHYTSQMRATLLLPAGVTSRASVYYKDEADLMEGCEDPDKIYVEMILPGKMEYNLESLKRFGVLEDLKVMILTLKEVFGKGEQQKE